MVRGFRAEIEIKFAAIGTGQQIFSAFDMDAYSRQAIPGQEWWDRLSEKWKTGNPYPGKREIGWQILGETHSED